MIYDEKDKQNYKSNNIQQKQPPKKKKKGKSCLLNNMPYVLILFNLFSFFFKKIPVCKFIIKDALPELLHISRHFTNCSECHPIVYNIIFFIQ